MFAVRATVALCIGLLACASPSAQARDWYILNFKYGNCQQAASMSPEAPTPELFRNAIREEGVTDTVQVTKGDDGSVSMVTIAWINKGTPVETYWFPYLDACESMRKIKVADGAIPDLNDLR